MMGELILKELCMSEGKHEARELSVRTSAAWLELFRGFQIAIDPRKLLLAAAGILLMSLGWWSLSAAFSVFRTEPESQNYKDKARYTAAHEDWLLFNRVAGPESAPENLDAATARKRGSFRALPWDESRGPNPFLLVTGQSEVSTARPGSILDWLIGEEAPVLLEPLVKFLQPIAYFVNPHAGFWTRIYFLFILLWTVAVWSLFGGAITRMAAVEIARREKVGMVDAVRFAYRRWVSFFSAPVFPLIFVAVLVVLMLIFSLFSLVPALGEAVNGILWVLALILGLLMAVVLVGLVGWPMMSATISTEGTDSWEAVSRSYSYIFQAPWHYLWYAIVAILYGVVLVFFVGLMGSLTVFLSRWAFSENKLLSLEDREPSYLFVYAPQSFGWRDLLLMGGHATDPSVEKHPELVENGRLNYAAYTSYVESMKWYNTMGAIFVSFWLCLFFLMIVGFGYSYFWVASTIIYFLMRRKVDDAEMDEVYLEEEEHESFFAPTKPPETAGMKPGPQMVDAPSLRVTPPPPPAGVGLGGAPPTTGTPPITPPPSTLPPTGDGNANKG
jgi:hypothetical protein